jgi:citrate lyase beta subunit
VTALEDLADELDARLAAADQRLRASYPGEAAGRQPVHTVYVPADRYDADTVPGFGRQAKAVLAENGGTAPELAAALGLEPGPVAEVYDRVRAKLDREPVEDLRIDFEDGYGNRPDAEEDAAAQAAAKALASSVAAGNGSPFCGIRFKSFEAPTRRRGLRTLDVFLETLGLPPSGFVVTLPKVTSVDQVGAMVLVAERLEQALGIDRLRFEIQVETPQSILGADGTALVARMIHAAAGRCSGLHYGTYDYSAACGIAAAYQSMEHPAADHAKAVMQVAAAGTGVLVSDGSTNVLPVGDADAVRAAWRLHVRLVRRSLERGFYQGWDLHPAQLPTRYIATYAFYRQGFPAAVARLRDYLGRAESGFLDEPATARALAAFLCRGLDCGAVDESEVGIERALLDGLARRATAHT